MLLIPPLEKMTSIEDLRQVAERRVPRMFYDYCDSGSWTEGTYHENEAALQKIKFRQRVAINMENRSTTTHMVGQEVRMPVALAPVGSCRPCGRGFRRTFYFIDGQRLFD